MSVLNHEYNTSSSRPESANDNNQVLEAAKLAYANKTNKSITSLKLGSQDFWRIVNSVLNKGKPAIYTSPIQQPRGVAIFQELSS